MTRKSRLGPIIPKDKNPSTSSRGFYFAATFIDRLPYWGRFRAMTSRLNRIAGICLAIAFSCQSAYAAVTVPPGNRSAEQPAIPGASAKRTKELSTTYEAKYRKIYNLLKRTPRCVRRSSQRLRLMASIRSISSVRSLVNIPTMSMSMTDYRPITSRPCPM